MATGKINPNNTQSELDLHDSEDDKRNLRSEETILDLPDVEDIPGQENVKVPRLGEYADVTASSADEEGDELFGDDDDLNSDPDRSDSNVTNIEKALLSRSASHTPDDESDLDVKGAALDRTDNEGAPLNEGNLLVDEYGEDLDLPEEEDDEEDFESQ